MKFWMSEKQVDGYRADVIGQFFESPQGCVMIPETAGLHSASFAACSTANRTKAMVAESSVAHGFDALFR